MSAETAPWRSPNCELLAVFTGPPADALHARLAERFGGRGGSERDDYS